MTDFIQLAKGKLNDPILMEWALDRYRDAQMGAQQRREAMERAWFDDLTLHRWLDSDIHDLLARLFFQLLAECCSNLGQAIGEQWGHWRGSLAYHAAPVLAHHKRVSPGSALPSPRGNATRTPMPLSVRHIAVNPADPSGNMLLTHEFSCASCGQWADFEFTTEAKLAITAELVKLATDSDAGLAGQNRVLTRAVALLNGRVRPVGEVVSHCQAAVARHPGSIGDWVRLAYCYYQVLLCLV